MPILNPPTRPTRVIGEGSLPGISVSILLWSNRFTVAGLLLAAIGIPELAHTAVRGTVGWPGRGLLIDEPGLVATFVALIVAHLMLRRIGALPLVDDKLLILPAFLLAFSLTAALGHGYLGSYGKFHLVTGFCLGVCWYFAVTALRARYCVPRLALVGELGGTDPLHATRLEWLPLYRPALHARVTALVFDKERELGPEWGRLFARAVLRRIPVYELSHLREMMTGRVRFQSHPEEVFGPLLPSQPYVRIKRSADFLVGVVALIVVLPIMLVVGIMIRLESPGPALFRQTRVGYQGRRFTCYKFRTMRSGVSGPSYTTENDPRITPLGRALRKWRIDELPQLLNVLRGEMSWIGPRPEALSLSREYERTIPYYCYRHAVRPGISGWAAVHQGNVALKEAAEVKLEYDFYYLKHFGIWLDFLIVIQTLRVIITGHGHR